LAFIANKPGADFTSGHRCLALAAATRLLNEISKRLGTAKQEHPEHSKPVKLLLYFDGADMLRGDKDFCPYTALIEVLDGFRTLDIFALFLSSSPSVLEIIPEHAQPPITELPFDICWNSHPPVSEGEHTLEDMCQQDFMAQFGRPMCVFLFVDSLYSGSASVVDTFTQFLCDEPNKWFCAHLPHQNHG
jgi:hypothetical protein